MGISSRQLETQSLSSKLDIDILVLTTDSGCNCLGKIYKGEMKKAENNP